MGPARFHCATLLLLWNMLEINRIIDFHILFELAQTCSNLFKLVQTCSLCLDLPPFVCDICKYAVCTRYVTQLWDFFIGQPFQILQNCSIFQPFLVLCMQNSGWNSGHIEADEFIP